MKTWAFPEPRGHWPQSDHRSSPIPLPRHAAAVAQSRGFWCGQGPGPRRQGCRGAMPGRLAVSGSTNGGGLLPGRRQAGGPRSGAPPPRPFRCPPTRRTSSPAGLASSARIATAPGPRAAAAGVGAGHHTPPCTRPSRPSSGLQAGPPGQQPACWGSPGFLPGWPVLAVCRPQGPLPATQPHPSSGLSQTPQLSDRCPTASQGLRRIRGSRAAQSWDQHRQQTGGSTEGACPHTPQGLAHSWGAASPALYRPPALWPLRGQNPVTQHKGARSTWLVCEGSEDPLQVTPHTPSRAGMGRVFTGPAPSSWRPVPCTPTTSTPMPSLACSRSMGAQGIQVTLLVP